MAAQGGLPLRGVTVLEVGGVAVAACGRLLRGLGALVVRVGPPGRGALARYLNAGKLCRRRWPDLAAVDVVLAGPPLAGDPLWPAGRALPDLQLEAWRRRGGVLVTLSAYGTGDPRSHWPASERVLQCAGGLALAHGRSAGPRPLAGWQAHHLAGTSAAIAVLAALRQRPAAGMHIDVSLQAAVALAVGPLAVAAAYAGPAAPQAAGRHSICLLAGRDGEVGAVVSSSADREPFTRFVGLPELADWDGVTPLPELQQWAGAFTRAELFDAAQAWRFPFAMALAPEEIRAEPHRAPRAFCAGGDGRGPWRRGARGWGGAGAGGADAGHLAATPRGVAADCAPGEASGGSSPALPLAHLRVVDLTNLWSGPLATWFLARLGAEVWKVEGPARPDGTRGPAAGAPDRVAYPGGEPGPQPFNRSAVFNDLNRGKRGIALDLRSQAGRAALQGLVSDADLIVENFTPRVMDQLGLGWPELHRRNPRLVMLSLPAYGASGPYRDYGALGAGLLLMSGLHQPGVWPGLAYGDPVAGLFAAYAALAALAQRDSSGSGLHVDLAQWEALLQTVGDQLLTGRASPPGRLRRYRCADGAWLAVEPVGRGRAARWRTLTGGAPARWAAGRPAAEAAAALAAAGIPAAVALAPGELFADDQLQQLGAIVTVHHPQAGAHPHFGLPWRTDPAWPVLSVPAPCFGQDAARLPFSATWPVEKREEAGLTADRPR